MNIIDNIFGGGNSKDTKGQLDAADSAATAYLNIRKSQQESTADLESQSTNSSFMSSISQKMPFTIGQTQPDPFFLKFLPS